jgi:hypothetical protein
MIRPGNLLTSFMDTMKRTSGISRNDVKAMRKRVEMAATRGVKFISPPAPILDFDTPMLLSDFRPPYPVTVIEGDQLPGACGLVIAHDTGDSVELNFITHAEAGTETLSGGTGGWFVSPLMCRIPYSDASAHDPYDMDVKIILKEAMKEQDLSMDSYKPAIRFYAAVCQILANHNVETSDVEPDAKAARSRRIRGKAPLFTYKTLIIGAPKKRQVVRGGGTHASPRSHLRRGFYRTSPKGVRHWVQACMVKGETPGLVHKDYQVEGGLK